jgi:hypothetical protein
VPDEVRRAIHSLENNKDQMWTRQACQQKYKKLEVETRVPNLKNKNHLDERVPKYWVIGVIDPIYKNRGKT